MDSFTWLPTIVLIALYGGVLFGAMSWMSWRRKTKWPFKESDKLLRGPGESLKRRLLEIDHKFLGEFVGGVLAVLLAFAATALLARHFALQAGAAPWLLFGSSLVTASASAWRITRLLRERSNKFVGWYGERIVADKLRPLQLQGFRVFHDVPAEPGKDGFNIDHVVVGPTGVAAVDVKARRKFKNSAKHETKFDGTHLIWPWGRERKSIDQAISQSDWLAKWIAEKVGLKVTVKPVLTIPGWFVKESPHARLRVVSTHFLCDAIRGHGEIVLTPAQVDQISRWLDERCRDVEE